MSRVKFDLEVMKFISLFEKITGAHVKDCIVDGSVLFIVQENDMGKAIGKKGINIKRMESLLKKKVTLLEFNPDLVQFVKNIVQPIVPKSIELSEDKVLMIAAENATIKGKLFGRDKSELKRTKMLVTRHFDVVDVKVV